MTTPLSCQSCLAKFLERANKKPFSIIFCDKEAENEISDRARMVEIVKAKGWREMEECEI